MSRIAGNKGSGGSNFYHSARSIGIATGTLNYQALAHKLVLDRNIAGIRYYVGKVSGEIFRVVQQEKFLSKLRAQGVDITLGRVERRATDSDQNPIIGRLKKLAEGERRTEKLIESDTPGQLRALPNFGALKMAVPDSVLDFGKLQTRVRESEIVIEQMRESWLHPDMLNTTMLQVGWPGGTLSLKCVGVPNISKEAEAEIRNTMQQFSSDCQMMLVWFAGILGSQSVMRSHLNDIAEQGEPFTINTYRPDGRVDSILARVPVDTVVEAFAGAGDFERLYAKAFVVFTYQIWEEVARLKIAKALKVEKPEHVKADLMGDWRHLRNWLVHRNQKLRMTISTRPGYCRTHWICSRATLVSLLMVSPR